MTFVTTREIAADPVRVFAAFEDPRVADGVAYIVVPSNEQNPDRLASVVLGGRN